MELKINNVSKSFYAQCGSYTSVFKEFSLSFEVGKITAIVGKSGTGKSTLLKMIAGLYKPDAGSVQLDESEKNVFHCSQMGQNLTSVATLVFQDYNASLLPWQRVGTAIDWGFAGNGEDRVGVVGKISETFGLSSDGLLDRYPHELSGGQKQRVAVARALTRRPKVLLMDEPFGSLDAFSRYELEKLLLKEWQQEQQLTIIIATHDLEEAVFLSHRVLVVGGSPCAMKGEVLIDYPMVRRSDEFKESEEFGRLRHKVRILL
jgi:NitT/TauT family transport system ATP-binding protein